MIARARVSMASTNAGISTCVPAGMAFTSAAAAFASRNTMSRQLFDALDQSRSI